MPKPNKRTVKFLRKASKNEQGVKGLKLGRKRARKEEPDMTEVEVDQVLPMGALKSGEPEKKKGSLRRHQEELDSLREKDPEFFEYLAKNDSGLLNFAADDDDDEEEDGELSADDLDNLSDEEADGGGGDDEENVSDSDEDENGGVKGQFNKPVKLKTVIETTRAVVDELIRTSLNGSLTSLKKLMSLLRAACLPSNAKDDDESSQVSSSRYLVNNPEVYEYAMTTILDKGPRCFYRQLDLSENSLTLEDLQNMGNHPKWKKVQFYVLSFFKSILHTLASLSTQIGTQSSEAGDAPGGGPQVAAFIVSSLDPFIPLLAPLPRLAKGVLKVLLRIWSTGPSPETDTCSLRVHTFLRIRQMAVSLPGAVAEECFRAIYLCYARTAKAFNEQTATSVVFMAQCVTELYQTDVAQAYQQGFLYIRQLALHLRTAVLKKTPEATKQVLTWQYLNCLRMWTRLLCSMPAEDDLGPLVFPLSQILYGVLTASPSSVYTPLHLHIISCIQQLAAHAKTFIPTAALLTGILESHELQSSNITASTDAPPRLQHMVRLPGGAMLKAPVRDAVVQATVNLLRYEADIYRFHVGFPEYSYSTIRKLKNFTKKCKVARWRDLCRALTNQYEQYSAAAMTKRIALGVAPMDVTGFEPLLPLCQRDQRAQLLPAHERLAKLMSMDSSSAVGDTSTVVIDASKVGAVSALGKGQLRAATAAAHSASTSKNSKKKVAATSDSSENDDDDDSNESASENDSGSEFEGNVDDMEDQVGEIDWSDDDN